MTTMTMTFLDWRNKTGGDDDKKTWWPFFPTSLIPSSSKGKLVIQKNRRIFKKTTFKKKNSCNFFGARFNNVVPSLYSCVAPVLTYLIVGHLI